VAISPLYYATAFAHDLTLRVHMVGQAGVDLAIAPDPVRGGLVIAPDAALPKDLAEPVSATLHGRWGFDPFTGPEITLAVPGDWHWQRKPGKDEGSLVLTGAASSCVAAVTVATPHGKPQPASWKVEGPDEIAVSLPTRDDGHEPLTVTVEGPAATNPATLTVAPPARPQPPAAHVVARSSEAPTPDPRLPAIQLDVADEVPANERLSFTLKAEAGEHFTGREVVEIGTTGSEATARLTIGNGVTLVDPSVMVVSLTPSQALGSSAYGPLRARLLRGDVAGDWLDVGTLVRLPRLRALDCPAAPAATCTLRGDALYLLASVSATREFENATSVPEGYPASTLPTVRPAPDRTLYVRLHDAPEVVNRLNIPAIGVALK
jgi:hypothetical protein